MNFLVYRISQVPAEQDATRRTPIRFRSRPAVLAFPRTAPARASDAEGTMQDNGQPQRQQLAQSDHAVILDSGLAASTGISDAALR